MQGPMNIKFTNYCLSTLDGCSCTLQYMKWLRVCVWSWRVLLCGDLW